VIAPSAPRRPTPGGGLAVLVVVTVLAALAAPHAQALRGLVADGLPIIAAPEPRARPASGSRPARAVAFALRQRGKPYRWGAQGPHAYDCSGLTWQPGEQPG
jgi:cell wall-associated NlpC family hydrolase